MTPSFRQLYEDQITKLQSGSGFSSSLIDLAHRDAFRLLLEDAWGPEHAAMSNSDVTTVMDALNLVANVHNRKLIRLLEKRILELQKRLDQLQPVAPQINKGEILNEKSRSEIRSKQ